MAHDHGEHRHDVGVGRSVRGGSAQRTALLLAIGANSTLLVAQVAVGLAIGSLALLADSLHNASDVVALVIALLGQTLARRPPTARRSYGLARAEVLAALLNGAVLLALTGWIIVEAVRRFATAETIAPAPLAIVGVIGLLVNGGSAWALSRVADNDLNLRAAFWHLAADALGSFGVIVAAAGVFFFDAAWVDPAVSILISLLVLAGVWRVLRDTVGVLLETTPAGVDPSAVESAFAAQPGVIGAHHLHIWAVDSKTTALTAHLEMGDDIDLHAAQGVMAACRTMLAEQFFIDHVTLEPECHDCEAPHHVP